MPDAGGDGDGDEDAGPECPLGDEGCPCLSGDTCAADLACAADDTCAPCPWGTVGCPCAESACAPGAVCDDVDDRCRAPTACEDAGCAQHQLCENAGGGDAMCIAECEDGWDWNASTNACDATPSCEPAAPGFLTCDDGVACVADAGGARCEGCLPGFIDVGGACLPDDECATYCGPHRTCTFGTTGPPACGPCEPGYLLDTENDLCVDVVTCAELSCGQDQVCIPATPTTDAECRDVATCPTGQVDTGTGTCVVCVHCYTGTTPLPGVTGVGNGGFSSGSICVCTVEEGWFQSVDGEVKSCDADEDGWVNADLRPVLQQNGGENPFATEQRCTVREVSQIELVADVPTAPGAEAASTHVVTVGDIVARYALPVSSYLLDAAGRAYVPLFEPEVLDEPDLFDLRYTSSDPKTRLRNYGGLAGATPDLHRLTAAETNPLSKWCNHDADDLNLDSIADVVQSHDVLPAALAGDVLPATAVLYRMTYFLELHRSYWRDRSAECAAQSEVPCHGAYVIREKARGLGASSPEGLELAYADRSEDGFTADYWQSCARSRDPDYGGGDMLEQPINMDFAAWHQDCLTETGSCLVATDVSGDGSVITAPHVAYDGRAVRATAALVDRPIDFAPGTTEPRWPGMNHHSQFKCVTGAAVPPAQETGRKPSGTYDLNDCRLDPRVVEGAAAGADPRNPKDPYLACTATEDGALPVDGYNRWAALVPNPSVDIAEMAGYAGGCAVEGAEWAHLCAASGPGGVPSGAVSNHPVTYGQLFCVCGDYRTGQTCEVSCQVSEALSDSFGGGSAVELVGGELVYQRTWVCLHPAASLGTMTGTDGTSSFRVTGEVPATLVPTAAVTGTDGVRSFKVSAPVEAP